MIVMMIVLGIIIGGSIITNSDMDDAVREIFLEHNLVFSFVCNGRGTASNSLLDYYGIEGREKRIYASLITKSVEIRVFEDISYLLSLKKIGNGICFSIPLSSSNGFVRDLLSSYKEEIDMEVNDRYHLVITSVLEGYSDMVMSAAKKGGASGGTVISGRSLGTGNANFLKLKIEPEKDIVLIVTPEYKKNNIMHYISVKCGIKTEAKGVCISIPIDSVIGING